MKNKSTRNKDKFLISNKNTKKKYIPKEKRLLSAKRKSQNVGSNKVTNNSNMNLYSVTYLDFEKINIKDEKSKTKLNIFTNNNNQEDSGDLIDNNVNTFKSKGIFSGSNTRSKSIIKSNTTNNFNKRNNDNKSEFNLSVNKLNLK